MTRYGTEATPDRYEYQIRVDGEPVESRVQLDVVEIDVAEEVGRHGRLALLLQNWNPDTREVRHSDDGPLVPGAKVQVLAGYHSELAEVFDGVVTSLTTHFPRGGQPVLRVEARSRSVLLDHLERSRQLEDVSDEDVAHAIAADYTLELDGAQGVTRRAVATDRATDWAVLKHRAQQLGWVVYVRGTTLVFRPPAEPGEPHELEYGLNVTELHLTQDAERAVASVTGAGWDTEALEEIESEAGAEAAALDHGERSDHGATADGTQWPMRDARVSTPTATDAAEAQARAEGRQRGIALGHCYGTASIVGNPALRCDQWVSITAVGTRMAGPHFVTGARHRISAAGYTTELQLGRPPHLVPPPASPAGALGVAVVVSLDDPDAQNRVKVRSPWRGDAEGVWARVVQADAGEDSGTVFTPDVGQEVVVCALDGDASQPVVLGTLHNGKQPPPYVSGEDNYVRAIVTPSGMRIVLDDKQPSVSIATPDGVRHVTLDDDAGTVTVADDSNSVVMDSAGITIDAAKDLTLKAGGVISLEGAQVKSKASGTSTFESSGTFDVKAAATLGLQGALVNIN